MIEGEQDGQSIVIRQGYPFLLRRNFRQTGQSSKKNPQGFLAFVRFAFGLY